MPGRDRRARALGLQQPPADVARRGSACPRRPRAPRAAPFAAPGRAPVRPSARRRAPGGAPWIDGIEAATSRPREGRDAEATPIAVIAVRSSPVRPPASVSRAPSASSLTRTRARAERAAVADDDLAVGVRRDARLVRDQHDRRAAFARGAGQQLHHPLAVEGVQRAGGLVGEQHARVGHQRARDRDALALAAGHGPGPLRRRRPRPRARPAARRRARSASLRGVPSSRSGSATFSRQDSSGTSWPNWKTNPNSERRSALRARRRASPTARGRRRRPCRSPAARSRRCSAAASTCPSPTGP